MRCVYFFNKLKNLFRIPACILQQCSAIHHAYRSVFLRTTCSPSTFSFFGHHSFSIPKSFHCLSSPFLLFLSTTPHSHFSVDNTRWSPGTDCLFCSPWRRSGLQPPTQTISLISCNTTWHYSSTSQDPPPRIMRHPNVRYRIHKNTPLVPTMNRMHSVYSLSSCLFKILFNIIFFSTSRSF